MVGLSKFVIVLLCCFLVSCEQTPYSIHLSEVRNATELVVFIKLVVEDGARFDEVSVTICKPRLEL